MKAIKNVDQIVYRRAQQRLSCSLLRPKIEEALEGKGRSLSQVRYPALRPYSTYCCIAYRNRKSVKYRCVKLIEDAII